MSDDQRPGADVSETVTLTFTKDEADLLDCALGVYADTEPGEDDEALALSLAERIRQEASQ